MRTEPDRAGDRVRKAGQTGVRVSMMCALGLLGLPLFHVSASQAAEDISDYPKLQEALKESFGDQPAAILVITRVVGEETETLTLYDPSLAVPVPEDEIPTGAFAGFFEIEGEVLTLTLSASPKCKLKKLPDGDYIWVKRRDDPPCPPE